MHRLPWVEREFSFDIPIGWTNNVISRLQGAEYRLAHYFSLISEEDAEVKPDDKWSMKEHLGHLVDLEALHLHRLTQFSEKVEVLKMADMSNVATKEANHNNDPINDLLLEFRRRRAKLIEAILELPEDVQHHVAMHPRLNVPMKPVDMAAFTAEHDDHHIHSIEAILQGMNKC